ncbi:creatininase family protein [Bradyrhizobium sp. LTSPM299]|uniref:creatininase family protein n=1 Tax=Bradyrhizobium sp. LTSPM299 TaxID=1619233 RepID=UPI000AAE0F20|nr:creatininase family protein [Bradyrhizobium sp. LTSPM299]
MVNALDHSDMGAVHEVFWSRLKATEFLPVPKDAVVILPIGSTEQHGPHLPVDVDSRLAAEIAARTAQIVTRQQPVLVLPALWVSLAEHHMKFGGTLTLDFATFSAVLRCIVRSLSRHGFSRIMLLNGHGGNIAALTIITDELSREFNLPLACLTYWDAANLEFAAILEKQPNLRHACEAETSMMMVLAPALVDAEKARTVDAPPEGLASVGGVHRWRPMEEWTRSGVVGVPAVSTPDKGARLLDAASKAIARRILDDSIWEASAKASPVCSC